MNLASPWERQVWDTDVSYYNFQTYYLALPTNERNLQQAYRNYRASKGLQQVSKRGKKFHAPGNWRNWADGKDPYGRRLPSSVFAESLPWAERARAYDAHLAAQAQKAVQDLWIQRQLDLRAREWEASADLFERAKQMRRAPVFRQTTTDTLTENGKTVNRTIVIEPADWRESDVSRTVEEASRLGRKAAEMDQEKYSVGDWRQELAQAGVDPDMFYDLLVSTLAAKQAGVSLEEVRDTIRSLIAQSTA